MHIGNAKINTDYTMRDIQIETIDMQKDLGILFSSDLKITKYCIEVLKRRKRRYRRKKVNDYNVYLKITYFSHSPQITFQNFYFC